MNITKALADENRVRVLSALSDSGELCVCQLIELLQLAPSTVSKHLFILRNARLINSRKQGRWMYYRLNTDAASPVVAEALKWAIQSVATDPVIQLDREKLAENRLEDTATKCGP